MTTISLAEWTASPEIVIGEAEHKRLTVVALTDLGERGDNTDFLLYELDRARTVPDAALPPDVVRIGSIIRYQPVPGPERMAKLVMPERETHADGYRLSVTSEHGAALIGTRPGHVMTWIGLDGEVRRLAVINVANALPPPSGPGPHAA
ncbi:regulator of nucleoside diphosphate kinase [Devosia subaequoris]|uniref:Regulator of nucleoside diphosphate kinase n=1 Tax=Devosia subaequoris TaxID=395930 RepID=A0A7W6NCY6_9HYPH|nr:GreA/GreB family elongation factor [Devosia subaequoris]MBB4053443.1 regulator of nucleoside diphosphate kinase [Devosia subaequoris]MCP1210819.1 GreA/GreB family elongation factor [Devosia subaequoris]